MLIARGEILNRYGLPNVATFEMSAQQNAQRRLRAKVKHEQGVLSMSLGHLASLENELRPIDPYLATQIRAVLKSTGF